MKSKEAAEQGNLIAIKGCFERKKTCCAFLIILSESQRTIVESICAVKTGKSVEDFDVNAGRDEFSAKLEPLAEKALADESLSAEIETLAGALCSLEGEKAEKLVNLVVSPGEEFLKVSLIRDVIREPLEKEFSDIEGRLETAYEKIAAQGKEHENGEDDMEREQEDEKIVMETQPVLDPVGGKKSSRITVGDVLCLRIASEDDLQEYGEELRFTVESDDIKTARIKGEVYEVISPELEVTGRTAIKMRLSERIDSVLYLSGAVKLGTVTEEEKPEETGSEGKEGGLQLDLKDKTIVILMVIVSLLIIIILIVLLTLI